jgi:hypothetical protein
VGVRLGEITDATREAVLALRVAPDQEQFVGSVQRALDDAAEYPHANPWYRAVYAGEEPDSGPPGIREQYSSKEAGLYYAAFLLDPDG